MIQQAAHRLSPGADLIAAIRDCAPELTGLQIDQLLGYRDVLHEVNQRINLTAIRDRQEMGQRLILESLRLVPALRDTIATSADPQALDLGTGGGIPGVILAIVFPGVPFTLLDATRKKLDAVQGIIDDLGLKNVTTLHGRAEEVGDKPCWRGHFTVLTARAVSSLPALIELGLPLLQMHGTMLLPKGIGIEQELQAGREAGTIVGGRITNASILPANGSGIDTALVVVEKNRPTPMSYPRRSGLPARQPLGGPILKHRTGNGYTNRS